MKINLKKITTSGCAVGTIFGDIYDEIKNTKLKSKKKIRHKWIYEISKKLTLTPSLYMEAGAIHGCAIIQNNKPLIYMEDVGRHNAVDKIAGFMFLKKLFLQIKYFIRLVDLQVKWLLKQLKWEYQY